VWRLPVAKPLTQTVGRTAQQGDNVLRVYLIEDIESVVAALKKEGYGMVDHVELFRRLNPIEAAQQGVQSDECPRCNSLEYISDPQFDWKTCLKCGTRH
jgi:hypothetical protein